MTASLAQSSPAPLHRAPASNHWRFVRAYSTTFAVIGSYTWLAFRARLFGRAYQEARILATHRRNAKRVEETILALQGLFIKVGQLLSILANFLPDDFRHGLEALQDQVPPRPFEEIEARITAEVGPIKDCFGSFLKVPVASASLGQVHEATLKDGTRVAVKVQHRDIDETVRLDLLTIRRIMTIVQWFVPVQGLDAYYHQIKELLGQELDFALEADNIERIAKNFASDAEVRFALPVRALSTRHVLVTQFVEGKKVSDTAIGPAGGAAQKDLAKRLVRVYCQMIFVDGVYHADPHPGNVMVAPTGELILLDFGAVAELSPTMRAGIPEFLEGVIRRDTDRLIKALRTMGFLSLTSDPAVSERIIEYFHRRFQEDVRLESFNLRDVKIDPQKGLSNLLDLRKMDIGLKELSGTFHVPKDWVLLERTILLLFGTCSLLDPELNPMAIVQPYLHEFVLGSRDWTEIAVETVREMALSAITLPDDMKKYLTRAVRGELEVRVRGLEDGGRTLYVVGRQIIYTTVAVAAGFAGLTLDGRADHPHARMLYGVAIFASVLLVLSSILLATPLASRLKGAVSARYEPDAPNLGTLKGGGRLMPRLLPRFLGNGSLLGLLLLVGCGSGAVELVVPVDGGFDGDATTTAPNPCGDAASCDAGPLPMGCDGGSCVPPESVGAGRPCTFTADCKAGYYCGADGTCDAAGDGGAGASCSSSADCVRGAVCYRATPGLYGVCAAPDGVSIPAECDGGCDAGLVSGGKGMAEGLGGKCKTLLDCQAGLACDPTTSTCEPGVPGQGLPVPWGGVTCNDANGVDAGATVRAYFEVPAADGTPPNDFFRLPFPNDIRRDPTTHLLNLTGFPTPGSAILGYDLVKLYVDQSEKDLDGFGTNQYVYFRFSSGINLDTLTVGTGGTVQSYDLTVGAATDSISFSAGTAGDHYICANNLRVTAGVLLPGHTYAVTVGAGVKDDAGHAVVADTSFPAMLAATAPTSASLKAGYAAYAPLRAFLATQQIDPSTILDAAVFTTQSATSEVSAMRTAVLAGAAPVASGFVNCSTGGVSPCDDGLTGAAHVRGCVGPFNAAYDELEGEITLPIMQTGTRPYTTVGQGAIALDGTGKPIVQGTETVCVSLTVPHGMTAPAAGWPVIVYAHGTGGDYLSGLQEGLALAATNVSLGGSMSAQFAFLGYDGVMTGPRRGAGVTEAPDTLFFNFANPVAARDNVLQGAADVYALVRAMGSVSLANLPATGTTTSFDATHVYFLGHSQGSTVGVPASVFEPGLAGMVYSGAGGDLRESLLTKTDPVDIAALTPYVLEDTGVDVTHPALNMFQAFFERADAVNYGGLLSNLPTGVTGRPFVQTYGLGDTYAPIPTLQALAGAIGEPATGPVVGAKPWPTATGLTLPVNDDFGTTSGMVTAGLLEADPMGAYDGHFILFDDPTIEKRVMQFLGTAATGTATIE